MQDVHKIVRRLQYSTQAITTLRLENCIVFIGAEYARVEEGDISQRLQYTEKWPSA
jgi:hypothetical protein